MVRYDALYSEEEERSIRDFVKDDEVYLDNTMDMYDFMIAVRTGHVLISGSIIEDRYMRMWSETKSIDMLNTLDELIEMLHYLNGRYDTHELAAYAEDYVCEFYDEARDDDDMILVFGSFVS